MPAGQEPMSYDFQVDGIGDAFASVKIPQQAIESTKIKFDSIDTSYLPNPDNGTYLPDQKPAHYDFDALVKQERRDDVLTAQVQTSAHNWSADSNPSAATYQISPTNTEWPARANSSASDGSPLSLQTSQGYSSHSSIDLDLTTFKESQSRRNSVPQNHHQQSNIPPQALGATGWPVHLPIISPSTPEHLSDDNDDDPFNISDDDALMEDDIGNGNWEDNHLKDNDLGVVVALQASQDNQCLALRSFTSFIDRADMLATYVPSPQSTPLSDSMTARIFCHFVNVTAPSLSMFERHPANPSLIFQGQPVPLSQQHVWTYTFPIIALHNPALLHAILALGSLHIAKLQNGPSTAALKHYAISLRRIAKCLSSPSKRGQPATLAACMLLAIFECWSADHQKWTNHLLGAKQLVGEIDFAGMTRYMKSQKIQRRHEEQMRYYYAQQQGAGDNFHHDRLRYQAYVDDVDEGLVGMLMGKRLRYDQFGQVIDDDFPDENERTYSAKDLEIYETQRDLFWWYCKQDAYQGILGGGRLFMAYDLWSHCPPRAPLGRLNATYGTFDHLILLMGRVADFAAKDLKRKRLQMKANGGWRRPGSLFKPQGSEPQGFAHMSDQQLRPEMSQMPQIPTFSGMIPGVLEPQLPMGFSPTRDPSPQSQTSVDIDLEAKRLEAEEEWQDIRNAFSILQDHFGEDFKALGPEFSAPIQTPFGPALQYRTYGIAGIWMNFYMALISCYRSHPSMPPAAMMATSVAARQTASYAIEIGRIAAGISPGCHHLQEVNPGVGAALIESSMCLFVSAVQYQDAAQRAWTITRLQSIARLTGWQTALTIATGCETSWCRAAEMGKGPPYERPTDARRVPDVPAGSRMIDRALQGRSDKERRLVVSDSDRAHYALGILGVDEDFENLDLGCDGPMGRFGIASYGNA